MMHLKDLKQKHRNNRNFYTNGGLRVYVEKPPIEEDIDLERIVSKYESILSPHLRAEIEMVIIGWFKEFEERSISAFYDSGTLFISHAQSSEEDIITDMIHETSHSIEVAHGYQIYGDKKIEEEFLTKRKHLHDLLWSMGYKVPLSVFMETEYNEELDMFLLQEVGYEKLTSIVQGMFISAYSPTSLREYFATGFTDFYSNRNHKYLQKVSPALYEKLILLHDEEKLDNQY